MAPMKSKSWCSPVQLVALMLAGWINRHQQAVIAYQREEIKVLRDTRERTLEPGRVGDRRSPTRSGATWSLTTLRCCN